MGNTLGIRRTTKVMKINGETLKLKTPVRAGDVVKDYPGYVLLESEAVKHFGIRAKPLEVQQELKPKRLYFLVELPKFQEEKAARRVRSGIHMSAKDRLESLMLARRSASDLTILRPTSVIHEESSEERSESTSGSVRVKMRVPKADVAKLMMESRDGTEAAEKIVDFCLAANRGEGGSGGGGGAPPKRYDGSMLSHKLHWNGGVGGGGGGGLDRATNFKAREKRVCFTPIHEGEIQLAVA